jgi:hypothetical protein
MTLRLHPLGLVALAGLALGCGRDSAPDSGGPGPAGGSTGTPAGSVAAASGRAVASPPGSQGAVRPERTAAGSVGGEATGSSPAASATLPGAEAEIQLGPAMAVALGSHGAVGLTQSDDLVVVPLGSSTPTPAPAPKLSLAAAAPSLTGGVVEQAYWLSRGRLVRRQLGADGVVGRLEELATDGSSSLPVAAVRTEGTTPTDVVVYVGQPEGAEGQRPARLWIEGAGTRRLNEEAGSATAVAAIRVAPNAVLALSLDGRLGTSSVHAVRVQLDGPGKASVGEDRVVYVGGSALPTTHIVGVSAGQSPIAFLPMPKDPSGFGLVSLLVHEGTQEASASLLDYPNGIDPAPVAAAVVCGAARVALVRPERAAPGSPQRLELGEVTADGRVVGLAAVASAARFVHVALAGRPTPAAAAAPIVSGAERAATSTSRPRGSEPAHLDKPARFLAGPVGGWVAYATDAGLAAQPIVCSSRSGSAR